MPETIRAARRIGAPPEAVFAVLADPRSHAAIDGTGWVNEAVDTAPITGTGQVFRMAMYHDEHPDKNYEMANEIVAFEPDAAIGWRPGQRGDDGELSFGGWFWRYDLASAGDATDVTLTYDWSQATPWARRNIDLPPFGPDHLDNSLAHLADLVAKRD